MDGTGSVAGFRLENTDLVTLCGGEEEAEHNINGTIGASGEPCCVCGCRRGSAVLIVCVRS